MTMNVQEVTELPMLHGFTNIAADSLKLELALVVK